jgi:REP element-mobilizing transposase RayT
MYPARITPSRGSSWAEVEEGWFHVVHRGVSRRPVFSRLVDVRTFLDILGRESGRGGMAVHSFSVLANHCHLLVHARSAELSATLRRVFSAYSRRLNRRLRRDGPLFGSRARVRRIHSGGHWRATVAYIDRNAVEAGLARSPAAYPFGSAWHYARTAGPDWLRRDVIEEFVRRESGSKQYRPADYGHVFGDAGLPAGGRGVAAGRLEHSDRDEDPLDDLLAAAPSHVRRWLERMASRADGAAAGPTLVDPRTLLACLDEARRGCAAWPVAPASARGQCGPAVPLRPAQRGGVRRDGWSVLACGLLRLACGLTLEEIGGRVGLSVGGVHFQISCHRRLVASDALYRARAEAVLAAALKTDFPGGAAGGLPGALWSE